MSIQQMMTSFRKGRDTQQHNNILIIQAYLSGDGFLQGDHFLGWAHEKMQSGGVVSDPLAGGDIANF